ncbi:IGF-like family receptor 1 isoform X1 [Alosa sapidissima]|uniref:IGF-like family receptor 1 isoform X1 n=1 Tax=Alosa sapidissima TaxID=34773 RepID=UPI001C0851D7|nr:IGF-like family receptor 1 isoform X1 [Alosa sapidissima]
MAYSENCKNLTTYWDTNKNNCVSCINRFPWPEAGKGFTANCGLSDDEGRHVNEYEDCSSGTYNNGSFLSCQKCSPCSLVVVRCTPIADTQCYVKHTTATYKDDSTPMQVMTRDFGKWIIIPIILVALFLFYIIRRRIITNREMKNHSKSQCSFTTATDTQLGTLASVDNIIAPELQMVPLQLLLDNMDVLEDLLILLDPDCSGLKNTRHLASRCHFSSTWINYAYSKRDSKSPLVAVLEAIAARSPEWTVGQLAWLLHDIDRHDAVNVLKKFSQPQKV